MLMNLIQLNRAVCQSERMMHFVIYLDIKSFLKTMNENIGEKIVVYLEHEAFSMGFF